jgi:hypothetical protein
VTDFSDKLTDFIIRVKSLHWLSYPGFYQRTINVLRQLYSLLILTQGLEPKEVRSEPKINMSSPKSFDTPWWWRHYTTLKRRSVTTRLQVVISQMTAIRTWYLSCPPFWSPHSLLSTEYQVSFHGGKPAAAWTSALTTIYCRDYECMDLYLRFPMRVRGVVTTSVPGGYYLVNIKTMPPFKQRELHFVYRY